MKAAGIWLLLVAGAALAAPPPPPVQSACPAGHKAGETSTLASYALFASEHMKLNDIMVLCVGCDLGVNCPFHTDNDGCGVLNITDASAKQSTLRAGRMRFRAKAPRAPVRRVETTYVASVDLENITCAKEVSAGTSSTSVTTTSLPPCNGTQRSDCCPVPQKPCEQDLAGVPDSCPHHCVGCYQDLVLGAGTCSGCTAMHDCLEQQCRALVGPLPSEPEKKLIVTVVPPNDRACPACATEACESCMRKAEKGVGIEREPYVACTKAEGGCRLAAGGYAEIHVRRNAKLTLGTGVFVTNRLDVEADGDVEVDGDTRVIVRDGPVSIGDRAVFNPGEMQPHPYPSLTPGVPPAIDPQLEPEPCEPWTTNLRVLALGNHAKAVFDFGKNSVVRGVFCTEKGLVQLNNHATVRGKIIAREIQGGKLTAVVCPAGAAVRIPPPPTSS